MAARAEVVGIIDGETLLTGDEGRPTVSFMLADDQRALSHYGLVLPARFSWCQVICRPGETAEVAASLRPGTWVAVVGVLKVIRPSMESQGTDAVLVSLIADSLRPLSAATE
jgi:hypothetical protein